MPLINITAKSRNKYNAKPTTIDGIRFDSKKEARVYQDLVLQWKAGQIRYFVRQVPIDLPGGVKMRVDFLVMHNDGHEQWLDAKGKATRDWLNKKKIAEAIYPIKIETI